MSWNPASALQCKYSHSKHPSSESKFLDSHFGVLALTNSSSHFNTAHFMNPDFQPEEWCPDGDYATGNKGRHKSYSS